MAENQDFSKYIIPAGAVILGFIALNRFFPAKPTTRQVLTSTGQVIDVAEGDQTFGGRLGSGLGQNAGEFFAGVPGGFFFGIGSELKRDIFDPLARFFRKETSQTNFPVQLITNTTGAVVGVHDPNLLVSRYPTAAERNSSGSGISALFRFGPTPGTTAQSTILANQNTSSTPAQSMQLASGGGFSQATLLYTPISSDMVRYSSSQGKNYSIAPARTTPEERYIRTFGKPSGRYGGLA